MFIYDISPCKDCKKRIAHCHATCEDYKNWKVEHDNRKAIIRQRENINDQIRASKIEFRERYLRKTRIKK